MGSLVEYLSLGILDPASLHDDIHPAPVSNAVAPAVKKGGKAKFVLPAETAPAVPEEDTSSSERLARYRIGGLVGLSRVAQDIAKNNIPLPEELVALLRHSDVWSSLSSEPVDEAANLGLEQPAIRKAAYTLLDTLIDTYPEEVGREETLKLLSVAVLASCWSEKDSSVWQQGGQAIVKFLSSAYLCWQG